MQLQVWVLSLFVFACLTFGDEGGHGHDDYEYSPYHYEYKVHDDKEYLDFGQEEEDDGQGNVHGYYHVMLPDGRHQRVDYHVSGYSGYIADVKYDGEAQHPSHHGHHSSGDHGRHGKSLSFGEQPVLEHKSQEKSVDLADFRSQVDNSKHDFKSFGRQGKSLAFEAQPVEALPSYSKHFGSQQNSFEHHDSGHFGSFGREGKSLDFQSKFGDTKPATLSGSSHFDSDHDNSRTHNSESVGSFGRQGKSLNFESKSAEENESATHSGTSHIGSQHESFGSHGSFGSIGRQGKSLDSKKKPQKSSLITRRRLGKSETLETSASEQVNTFQPATSASEQVNTFQPATFFDQAPTNVKSPFPSNFHEQLQSRNAQNQEGEGLLKAKRQIQDLEDIQKEVAGLQNAQRNVHNLQHIQQEFQGLQHVQKEIKNLQQIQHEVQELQSDQYRHESHQHQKFPSLITHEDTKKSIRTQQQIQQEDERVMKYSQNLKDLQEISEEVEGLQIAQRNIQNLHHIQQEFQGLQNAQKDIQNLEHVHVPLHQRFPSLIPHDLEQKSAAFGFPTSQTQFKPHGHHHTGYQIPDPTVGKTQVQESTLLVNTPLQKSKEQNQGEVDIVQSQQKGFTPVIRGRIIHSP